MNNLQSTISYMLRNYFKIAIRNLLKRKVYSLINILGLATGMAVCLLILQFIKSELGYDKFHEKADRIYRIALERKYPGRASSYAIIPSSIGEGIQKEYPEVQECTRVFANGGNTFIRIGERIFEEKRVFFADSNFFRVFSANIIEGNPAEVLNKPKSVVLNETTAKKYFGSASAAMNKVLELDGGNTWIVSGVMKDWPEQSHMLFDLLVSTTTFGPIQPNYISFSANTYLLLKPSADPVKLEAKFPAFIEKYVAGPVEQNFGVPFKQFQAAGNGYHYYLQPITKIHLTSNLEAELRPNGSIKVIYVFSVIAIFILALACINFVNLSTARSVERAKEVGIRKTFGSEKGSLIRQFLFESLMISFFSLVLAIGLIWLILPFFDKLANKSLAIADFFHYPEVLFMPAFALFVGLVAGIYPAFVLSSFKPITVLKGKFTSNHRGLVLRNGLVIFQFAISVFLIVSTLIVNKQLQYVLGEKLGFKKDHIVVIERTDLLDKQWNAFRDELKKVRGVENVSGTTAMPGQPNFFGVSFSIPGGKEPMTGRGVIIDEEYGSSLNLELTKGRFFSKEFGSDSLALVLNEKAVADLGLKDPIGAQLTTKDEQFMSREGTPLMYTIVGVVKDFHFQSLHQQIAPLVFINKGRFPFPPPNTAVRLQATEFGAGLNAMENVWKKFVKEKPFHFQFLDQQLAEQYNAEQTTRKVFTAFSIMAIFIACIGLLGLATYATQQRIREISIRKVLGASVSQIIQMLSKDFLKLVVVASVIAFPFAWWAMHVWLQDFVYRIDINPWVFALSALGVLIIALLTISFQAIKAALTSPVKSLRSE